eukprot:XP_016656033.1 PREDICTED: uncharacterized protein LOC107882178 [Acyrthosiphon pisum]
MDLENQIKLLKTMDHFILEMRVVGHKTLLPFQKGILYSNQSLRNLLIDLKLKYPDISYIITRRLNQDILENLYTYLKAMSGANTHLSPLGFKHCLKWYLLDKHASIALYRNTEDTIGERLIDTECLSASIVKESEILQTHLDNDHMSTEELSYSAADNHFLVLEEDKDFSELFKTESASSRTVEHEALEYVVGYVARRFVHKYPDLGNETSVSLDSSISTSWTQHITRGHLITPSDTLMRVAKVMNKYFEEMHGTSLNKNPQVMETLKTKVILEILRHSDLGINIQFTMQNTRQITAFRRCKPVKSYKKSSFVDIYEVLQSLQNDEVFCDVKLVTEDDNNIIFAHKVVLASASPYFHAMFTKFAERNLDLVVIRDIDSTALLILIDLIYSGKIMITEDNVQILFSTSNFLQLEEVTETCCEFLLTQLCPANCIDIYTIADLHSCTELLTSSERYIQKYFSEVVAGEDFLSLSSAQLMKLISSDKLKISCEEKIFESVIRWVKHELDLRKCVLP